MKISAGKHAAFAINGEWSIISVIQDELLNCGSDIDGIRMRFTALPGLFGLLIV